MAGVNKESKQEVKGAKPNDLDEEMVDDELSGDGIVEVDEISVAANSDQVATRRRLEDYLEERRLRKELDDDLFGL
ncbi:MAG: hypothetical protein OEZ39_04790 [Gammaproteobacteria bacterium]|nr:hypothetical protein [Gammaproteobacteria bacterium]MDH5651175.1 hypothetical protein [Gammaproteobacteria bacterium]